jgi:hypothetical protein
VIELTRFEYALGGMSQSCILDKSPPSISVILSEFLAVGFEAAHNAQIRMRRGPNSDAPRAAAKANPAGPPPTITMSLSLTCSELKDLRNSLGRHPSRRDDDLRVAKKAMKERKFMRCECVTRLIIRKLDKRLLCIRAR